MLHKKVEKDAAKFTTQQSQQLCELYRWEDLWNFSSAEYYKTEKRDAALERIKEAMASTILLTGTIIHK